MRLSSVEFKNLVLQHLISGIDEESKSSLQEGAEASSISGYTEWQTTTSPLITLGWDWRIVIAQGCGKYVRYGYPRSNVMLVDENDNHDLSPVIIENFLSHFIDTMTWEAAVQEYIKNRYL